MIIIYLFLIFENFHLLVNIALLEKFLIEILSLKHCIFTTYLQFIIAIHQYLIDFLYKLK